MREGDAPSTVDEWRRVFYAGPLVIYTCKASDGHAVTSISENVKERMGYEPLDFLNDSTFWARQIHPDDATVVLEDLPLLFEKGSHAHRYRFLCRDGTYRWLLDNQTLIRDDDGNPKKIIGCLIEITDCNGKDRSGHEGEEPAQGLQASEAQLRAVFDNTPVCLNLKDTEGRYLLVNKTYEEWLGFRADEIVGRKASEFMDTGGRVDELTGAEKKVLETGEVFEREITVTRPDGQAINRQLIKFPVKSADGSVTAIGTAAFDITARKQAENALREQRHQLSATVNAVPHGVITIDMKGIIQSFNPAATRIFGYSFAEILGKNVGLLMPESARRQHDDYLKRFVETGESKSIGKRREVIGRRKDGSTFPLEIAVNWMEVHEGVRFVGVCQDITRRKQIEEEKAELERELLEAHKLESLGTLSGGIAHEINTPVQYVGDNIRFLNEAFSDLGIILLKYGELLRAAANDTDVTAAVAQAKAAIQSSDLPYLCDEIPTAVNQSLDGVQRISEIVKAIKEFSHPGPKEKTPTKINRGIETTITVARNQWKYVAELTTDFDESLPDVPCVPGEFNQVILNLIVNAAHAIEEKGQDGHITISTQQCGSWAEIRVSDDGPGIPEEVREKVFEPFFTTKEPGKGTGQGLAISRTIITKSHGGTMSLESEVGKGTTFTIRLPLADAA